MLICLSACLLPMAGRTAGPTKTKLGIGTHVDPGSVLVNVKVIWRHLANANKTPYRGPQGPREFERKAEARKGRQNLSAKRDKYGDWNPKSKNPFIGGQNMTIPSPIFSQFFTPIMHCQWEVPNTTMTIPVDRLSRVIAQSSDL